MARISFLRIADGKIVTMDHTMVCVSSTSGNVSYSVDSLANWNQWNSVGSPP
jgi:hypothetical protein